MYFVQSWHSRSKDYQCTTMPNSCCGTKWKFRGNSRLRKTAHYFQDPLYNSPTWPVWKWDGRWHLAIDYQLLNANMAPLRAAILQQYCNLNSYKEPHTVGSSARCDRCVLYGRSPCRRLRRNFLLLGMVHNILTTDFHRGINIHPQLLIPCLLNFHRQSHSFRMWNCRDL